MLAPAKDRSHLEVQAACAGPGAERLKRAWFAGLTAAPVLFVVILLVRYAVNVPYLDQWDMIPLVDKAYSGGLSLSDVWTPHNEHRIFFPQLIMLGLARLTHWNIGYELGVNLVLALALLAVFVWQIRATARALSLREWHKLLPAISVVVFSVSQYQNWLWGFQSALFLNMLTATAGLLLLAQRNFSWKRFILAAALGVVATFSFATGVGFWPVGFILVLCSTKGRRRLPVVLAWLALSGFVLSLFFYHFNVAGSDSVRTALSSPLECVRFLLKYTGGITAQYPGGNIAMAGKFALIFGFGAIAVAVWSVWKLIRVRTVDWGTLLPYLGASLYSLGGGALAAVGRVCLGSDQAASSRYCTMVVPFWVSLMVFLFLLLKSRPAPAAHEKTARWCSVGAVLLLVLGSVLALDGAGRLSARQANGRDALLTLARNRTTRFDYSQLFALYPKLNVVVERYPVLKERRLSLFSDEAALTPSPGF